MCDDFVQQVNGLSFDQDAEGNWGYKPSGADSVIPFKTGYASLYFPVINLTANGSGYAYEEAAGAQSYGSASNYFEINVENYSTLIFTSKSGTIKMIGTNSAGSTSTVTLAANTSYNISSYVKIRLTISLSASKVTSSGWAEAKWSLSGNVKGLTIK